MIMVWVDYLQAQQVSERRLVPVRLRRRPNPLFVNKGWRSLTHTHLQISSHRHESTNNTTSGDVSYRDVFPQAFVFMGLLLAASSPMHTHAPTLKFWFSSRGSPAHVQCESSFVRWPQHLRWDVPKPPGTRIPSHLIFLCLVWWETLEYSACTPYMLKPWQH